MVRWLIIVLVGCAAAGWWLTRPTSLPAAFLDGVTGDATRGALVFDAGGCASCHTAPGASDDPPVLAGGYRIESPFGTFVAPNISPSQAGIAGWSAQDLANAMVRGVSPDGRHYYPAFPYTTYQRMTPQDIADLKAYLDTLPETDTVSAEHELALPYSLRRGIGLWKRINQKSGWVLNVAVTPELERGRYLVEALSHCGECHTPRNNMGGLDRARWMQGAPNPSGKGDIPGITQTQLKWSASDIAYYLESGFTPDYDSAGGQMAKVIEHTARLPGKDRAAIASYLKALPN